MALKLKNLIGGFSRLALMGSVALPSSLTLVLGAGMVSAPLVFAPAAEAAVIIGNRNKIKQKPRRNYKSTVRIDSDIEDAAVEVLVTGEVRFFAPDGTPGPVRELNLTAAKTSRVLHENPAFEGIADASNNILAAKVEGGACDGAEINLEVPFESKSPVPFTLCETGEGAITGKASFTNAGKPRVFFDVPTDISARTALYGRILIKGEPLEMERTVYTGDVNDLEVGAVAGFTYEQTITVTDLYGKTLDSQTVRGIVGEDDVDVMGPSHVIIGNRNKLRQRPRRNYSHVGVTRESIPADQSELFTVKALVDVTFDVLADTAPPIPPISLTEPARANLAVTYADGPGAGDILSGGYCGGTFNVPVGGVDIDDDGEIDDMSGTAIEGTELKIRANPRLDGTLRVRIKGDYAAFESCSIGPLFVENSSGDVEDSFVNYIWEGEIDADPRIFDGAVYSRTTTLTDESGKLLDSFSDLVALDPPTATTARASGAVIIGDRNRIRQKPRRNYQGKTVSNGGGDNGITVDLTLAYPTVDNQRVTPPTTTITTPLNSTYLYEVDGNGEGVVQPEPWCGYDIGSITLGEDTQIGDQAVTASMSERGNGNYRIKFKGAGEAFAEQCVGQNELVVNGELAYDLGPKHVWLGDIEGLPDDLPEETVFDFTSTLVNADTGEALARSRQTLTANDVPREGPQISVIAFAKAEGFDRGVQAVLDGDEGDGFFATVITEGIPQFATFATRREPDLSGTGLTVNICHLFTAPEVTFADPDSVLDMKYLLEVSTADENGEENGYMEYLFAGSESGDESLGEQVSGDAFEVDAVLLQNDDMETYEVSVSLCGAPKNVSEAAVFMTPQDGGSDVDPEDFTLEFVDKVSIIDTQVPARDGEGRFGFGTALLESNDDGYVAMENPVFVGMADTMNNVIAQKTSGGGGSTLVDVWECQESALTEGAGDPYCGTTGHLRPTEPTGQAGVDYISALVRGKGSGTKRSTSSASARPQLQ